MIAGRILHFVRKGLQIEENRLERDQQEILEDIGITGGFLEELAI